MDAWGACERLGEFEPRRPEILRYLGHGRQEIDDSLLEDIHEACDIASGSYCAQGVWRVFGSQPNNPSPGYALEGTGVVFADPSVLEYLGGSAYCGVMACTLGSQADVALARWASKRPYLQLLLDAVFDDIVEQACDALEGRIVAWARSRDLYTAYRNSPGYGGFSLSNQPAILSCLQSDRLIGVTSSQAGTLFPMKSVTAIVGIYPQPFRNLPAGCSACEQRSFCSLRLCGLTCYRHA